MANFVEFFAGIGLVREAVEPLGWQCVLANDIAPEKARMYTARFGGDDLLVRDVHDVSVTDLPSDITLATASFPCVDLSLAGNRAGLAGKRSGTIWPFLNLVEAHSRTGNGPTALMLENVTGFLTSHSGQDLADVCARLATLEYRLDLVVVDACWFVPQSRPRLFVLAVRSDALVEALPPNGETSRLRNRQIRAFQHRFNKLPFFELPLPNPPHRTTSTLATVLEDVPVNDDLWWSNDRVTATLATMTPRHRRRVHGLAYGHQNGVATMFRRVRHGRTVAEVRDDCIAGCLRTPLGGSSVQFLIDCRQGLPRVRSLTGLEYARLQGAGEFPINVGRRQAQLGFGDAVCVPAVRWLVDHSFGFLLGTRPIPVTDQLDLACLEAA